MQETEIRASGRPALYATALLLAVAIHVTIPPIQHMRTVMGSVNSLCEESDRLCRSYRFESALEKQNGALALLAHAEGQDSERFVSGLERLGRILGLQGNHLEAGRTFLRAAEIWRTIPEKSDETLRDLCEAAEQFNSCGAAALSQSNLERTEELFRAAPSTPPRLIVRRFVAKAESLRQMGRLIEADEQLEMALSLARERFGYDASIAYQIEIPLGRLLDHLGAAVAAVDVLDRAAEFLERRTLVWWSRSARLRLAQALVNLGDLPSARTIIQTARRSPRLGVDTSMGLMVRILATEAAVELAAGNRPGAEQGARSALSLARTATETECALVGTALAHHSETLVSAGVAPELGPLLERGAIREYGLMGRCGTWAEMRMAIALTKLEVNPLEALALLEEALATQERPDNRLRLDAIRCRRALAAAHERRGDRTTARIHLRRAREDALQVHGAKHSVTRGIDGALARLAR